MKKLIVILLTLCFVVGCGTKVDGTEDTGVAGDGTETTILTTLEEKQEVVIWHTLSDAHVEALTAIVDRFNEENEMVDVVLQVQPLTDFDSKVMQAVRNGVGPDMIFTYPSVAANYINEGLAVDFGVYVDNEEIGIENYSSLMTEAVYEEATQWDGHLYVLPIVKTGEIVYYNKTLYDSLGLTFGETWTELEENSRTIAAATGKPGFGFDSEVDGLLLYALQAGSGYIDADTKTALINNDIMLESLETIGTLVQEGTYRLVGEDVYFSNPFGAESVAAYIGSSAGYAFVEMAVDGKFELGTAAVPQEGTENYVNSWGSNFLAFVTTEEKALACYEFAKWFTEPEVNAEWAIAFGAVPVMLEAQESDVFQAYAAENPAAATLVESLQNVGFVSSIPGSADVRTALTKAIQEVALGVKDAETALNEAEATANEALAQ